MWFSARQPTVNLSSSSGGLGRNYGGHSFHLPLENLMERTMEVRLSYFLFMQSFDSRHVCSFMFKCSNIHIALKFDKHPMQKSNWSVKMKHRCSALKWLRILILWNIISMVEIFAGVLLSRVLYMFQLMFSNWQTNNFKVLGTRFINDFSCILHTIWRKNLQYTFSYKTDRLGKILIMPQVKFNLKISILPEPVFKNMGQQMSGPNSSNG